MNVGEALGIEGTAEQLIDYLYPKGAWIGTVHIQTEVFIALTDGLKREIDKKRRAQERAKAHKERQYDGPAKNSGCGQREL